MGGTAGTGHALRERALAILADLVAFPTVSSESNLALVRYVEASLADCGADLSLTRDETGGKANVLATIGPHRGGGVMLAGHSDVVPADGPWPSDPFALRVGNGRLYGRGTCDMKGFLACVLASAPRFASARLERPLQIAMTYDEEVGCRGAKVLLEELAGASAKPAICIVGEPTEMQVVEAHKGCFEYTTEFVGLPGHGSAPDLGVNAVHHAARFVAFLLEIGERLKDRAPQASPFDPSWTTVQVGRISGGEARNIIAGNARVEWEFRPINRADADFVLDAVHSYIEDAAAAMRAGFPQVVMETIGEVIGLEPVDASPASRLALRLNGGKVGSPASFGTEAGLYQALGISTVLCGPGSIEQAHTTDEFIEIGEIDRCLDWIGGLVSELERPP